MSSGQIDFSICMLYTHFDWKAAFDDKVSVDILIKNSLRREEAQRIRGGTGDAGNLGAALLCEATSRIPS